MLAIGYPNRLNHFWHSLMEFSLMDTKFKFFCSRKTGKYYSISEIYIPDYRIDGFNQCASLQIPLVSPEMLNPICFISFKFHPDTKSSSVGCPYIKYLANLQIPLP
jgi:hypothetical protein